MGPKDIIPVLPFIFLLLPSPGSSWEKEFTRDGIAVFTKIFDGSSIRAFRAEAVIDEPIEKIDSILRDTRAQTKWMPDCIVSEVLVQYSDSHEIAYNETRVPLANNRDIVVETRISRTSDTIVHVFKAVDRPDLKPEILGNVRIKIMEGRWLLTRRGGSTEVIYEVAVDPGGNIPAWVANMASRDVPRRTILGLIQFSKTLGGR